MPDIFTVFLNKDDDDDDVTPPPPVTPPQPPPPSSHHLKGEENSGIMLRYGQQSPAKTQGCRGHKEGRMGLLGPQCACLALYTPDRLRLIPAAEQKKGKIKIQEPWSYGFLAGHGTEKNRFPLCPIIYECF